MQFAFPNSVIANINYDAITYTHIHTDFPFSWLLFAAPETHATCTCLSSFVGDGISVYVFLSSKLVLCCLWSWGCCVITVPGIYHLSFTDFTRTACLFVPSTLWKSWLKLMRKLQFQSGKSNACELWRREFFPKNFGLNFSKKIITVWHIKLRVCQSSIRLHNPPLDLINLISRWKHAASNRMPLLIAFHLLRGICCQFSIVVRSQQKCRNIADEVFYGIKATAVTFSFHLNVERCIKEIECRTPRFHIAMRRRRHKNLRTHAIHHTCWWT